MGISTDRALRADASVSIGSGGVVSDAFGAQAVRMTARVNVDM